MPVRLGAGTYGPREVLHDRRFSTVMRDFLLGRPLIPELPGRAASQADVDAVRAGESRIIACYLRGSFEPYPRRLIMGKLLVSADTIIWTPYFRFPWRHAVRIDFRVLCVQTCPPGVRELGIPGGEKLRDGVMVSKWTVVTAKKPGIGSVDFALPTPDVQLVSAWLTGNILLVSTFANYFALRCYTADRVADYADEDLKVPKTCVAWANDLQSAVPRPVPGEPVLVRTCDDTRFVGLKLIFLAVSGPGTVALLRPLDYSELFR